ncbi:hypothetical protein GCM10027268_09780 [Brachybacterium huguangmaarense]
MPQGRHAGRRGGHRRARLAERSAEVTAGAPRAYSAGVIGPRAEEIPMSETQHENLEKNNSEEEPQQGETTQDAAEQQTSESKADHPGE